MDSEDGRRAARDLARDIEAVPFTTDERRELWSRIEASRGRWRVTRRWPALAMATAAAAIVFVMVRTPERTLVASSGAECVSMRDDDIVVGSCPVSPVLSQGGTTFTIEAPTRLERDPAGYRLRSGAMRVQVSRRQADEAPLVLVVSHGRLMVLGTAFEVQQGEVGGSVRVDSGSVRFEWSDGAPDEAVVAGSTLRWPREVSATPAPSDPGPRAAKVETPARARPKPAAPLSDVVEVVRRVYQLEAQGRLEEAAALLDQESRDGRRPAAQRARLSFERGRLLLDKLHDQVRGCAHLREHEARFPVDPEAARVREYLDACD